MKLRFLPLLLAVLLLFGCAQTAVTPDPSSPDSSAGPAGDGAAPGRPDLTEDEPTTSLTCRIADGAGTDALLLAGEDGTVYALDSAVVSALQDGMTVTVTYTGNVMETWPVQFGEVCSLTVADEAVDDRCGLYLRVLEDLWETDPGLNSDVTYLGMDLSGLTHLTQAERAAVSWRFAEIHGLSLVEGTWEELCDAGYIDRENLFWEDGVFFSISTDGDAASSLPGQGSGEEPPALAAFDAEKWRSGLGAYFFCDCEARRGTDGSWTYSVGAEAIS